MGSENNFFFGPNIASRKLFSDPNYSMPETFDDYGHMDEADLAAPVSLFRAMGPGK